MVGTGEIKYPERTKTSTPVLQFDLAYQGLVEENLDQKYPGPPVWGLMQQTSSLLIEKKETTKKPIGHTLDGFMNEIICFCKWPHILAYL